MWKYQQDEKQKNMPNSKLPATWDVVFTVQAVLICGVPIGLSYTEHLKSRWSLKCCEVEVLSKQKTEVLPCSVMLTGPHCQSDGLHSPNKCPHPAVSHRGCWQKVSDNLTGEMRHLHQIINTLTDRRQSVLGEPFFAPNIGYRDKTLVALLSGNMSPVPFPCGTETSRLQNESDACNKIFWK